MNAITIVDGHLQYCKRSSRIRQRPCLVLLNKGMEVLFATDEVYQILRERGLARLASHIPRSFLAYVIFYRNHTIKEWPIMYTYGDFMVTRNGYFAPDYGQVNSTAIVVRRNYAAIFRIHNRARAHVIDLTAMLYKPITIMECRVVFKIDDQTYEIIMPKWCAAEFQTCG